MDKSYTEQLLSPTKALRTHEIELTTLSSHRATEYSPLMALYFFGGVIISMTAFSLLAIFCTVWMAVIYYNSLGE